MNLKANSLVMISAMLFAIPVCYGKDFGKFGHVYNIKEQPFLEMINDRLQKVDIEEEQKKMVEMVKKRVMKPHAVDGVLRARQDRSWYFDPTYVVKEDIILPCGKVLHKSGTKVNPLEHMNLDRKLIFIDESDEEQSSWLFETISKKNKDGEQANLEERIILVSGNPIRLKEELVARGFDHEVYFDQFGELTSRFGIKAVPAIAKQEGLKIRINEISME